jgi:hypothetical protein
MQTYQSNQPISGEKRLAIRISLKNFETTQNIEDLRTAARYANLILQDKTLFPHAFLKSPKVPQFYFSNGKPLFEFNKVENGHIWLKQYLEYKGFIDA